MFENYYLALALFFRSSILKAGFLVMRSNLLLISYEPGPGLQLKLIVNPLLP